MIVGYTTGVYDMFHIGHLNILKRAKEQCDYLIVGVSTDELVQHDKNKTPIIPFADRCAIVESIKYVDQVVAQENKNKYDTCLKAGAFPLNKLVHTFVRNGIAPSESRKLLLRLCSVKCSFSNKIEIL